MGVDVWDMERVLLEYNIIYNIIPMKLDSRSGALIMIAVLFFSFLVFYMLNNKNPPVPGPNPIVIVPHIGGCSGTRYGCCPNKITPKNNEYGTNCYV